MLRIASIEYPTFPITEMITEHQCENLYLVPTDIDYCPICGANLISKQIYTIKVSSDECVKISGAICTTCEAFYTTAQILLYYLEDWNREHTYKLISAFYDSQHVLDSLLYQQKTSLFRQFILFSADKILTMSIVFDPLEADNVKHIFHYSSSTAKLLLKAEYEGRYKVRVGDKKYTIVKIVKGCVYPELSNVMEYTDEFLAKRQYKSNLDFMSRKREEMNHVSREIQRKVAFDGCEYEVYPISMNTNRRGGKVYPIPCDIDCCPICGMKFSRGKEYEVAINEKECIRFSGRYCNSCKATFVRNQKLLNSIYQRQLNIGVFKINNVFSKDESLLEAENINNIRSAFREYYLFSVQTGVRKYIIVYDMNDVNVEKNVIYYDTEIAKYLEWRQHLSSDRTVIIDKVKYIVVEINKREIIGFTDRLKIQNGMKIEDDPLLISKLQQYGAKSSITTRKTQMISKKGDTISKNNQDNSDLPVIRSTSTIYIYNGRISCIEKNHEIVDYKAQIDSIDRSITFFVQYCRDCQIFLMKYDDYKNYLDKYKFFPLRIHTYKYEINELGLAKESPLMLNGYSVGQEFALTQLERQKILSFIIEHGILGKREVLDYLEFFISMRENNRSQERAVQKWEDDKSFVLNYQMDGLPKVVIGKIEKYQHNR